MPSPRRNGACTLPWQTLWKPATTREIAERARLASSICSAQLKRLIGRGVVSDEGGTPRRKQYYLCRAVI